MKTSQINAILAALAEIRDRLPAPATTTSSPAAPVTTPQGWELAVAKRDALGAVLRALTGWVEGARENHAAMEHRNENRGEECWRQFAPSDIRHMINDAAREVGLAGFPAPKPGAAPEDTVRR